MTHGTLVNKDIRARLYKWAKYICVICKVSCTEKYNKHYIGWKIRSKSGLKYKVHLTIDHLVPTNKNGRNHPYNYIVMCNECNNKKNNIEPRQWIETLNNEYLKEILKLKLEIMSYV